MSEKNNATEIEVTENKAVENEAADIASGEKLVVKKKKFKKSDILVFGVCLIASLLVWLYATNLQKTAKEKEKEDLAGAVESGINKTTETLAETGESTAN